MACWWCTWARRVGRHRAWRCSSTCRTPSATGRWCRTPPRSTAPRSLRPGSMPGTWPLAPWPLTTAGFAGPSLARRRPSRASRSPSSGAAAARLPGCRARRPGAGRRPAGDGDHQRRPPRRAGTRRSRAAAQAPGPVRGCAGERRAAVTAAPGEDGWQPEFDGQRPPFTPGNESAVVHGARSERHVGPLAAQIAADLLADPDTPPHLHEPLFASAIQAWARAEAVCRLLWQWLDGKDVVGALSDLATTTEDEEASGGMVHRKSVTRHMPSVLEQLRKFESQAANLRARLGLDPASAAKVGRDLAARRYMDAAPLNAALAEIEERRALTAGGGHG